ncbi:MAG: FkbM family methyltransferase, partial [Lapillicoccus sp.]
SFVARLREARPRDDVVEAAVTSHGESVTLHLIADTGLSTLDETVSSHHAEEGWASEDVVVRGARLDQLIVEHGYDTGDVHFLIVDVEGFEADVLSTVDLRSWRPWVLVIEATAPLTHTSTHETWEPDLLEAGYEFCLFDGVSRFYVASERANDLKDALSYPACALDSFVDDEDRSTSALKENVRLLTKHIEAQEGLIAGLRDETEAARGDNAAEILYWRRAALVQWATTAGQIVGPTLEADHLRMLLEDSRRDAAALRQTVSWRVTRPLRGVRRLAGGVG